MITIVLHQHQHFCTSVITALPYQSAPCRGGREKGGKGGGEGGGFGVGREGWE